MITVDAAPSNETASIESEFVLDLQDQRVKVGNSLVYFPEIQYNAYSERMQVEVFLGESFRFMTFNEDLNQFKVNGNLLTREDIGDYLIQVNATFFNSTFEETFSKTFILTVWDDDIPEKEEPLLPPEEEP